VTVPELDAADAALPSDLPAVAERAARAGGDYLAAAFRDGAVDGEYDADDVKAVADREAERRVLDVIEAAYPDHGVHGEESGRRAGAGDGADLEWIVDPLDGTNNFAAGLPAFATAVALCHWGDPLVAAVYEPLPDSLYLAVRGAGATVNGDPLDAPRDHDDALGLDRGTVSLVVGVDAVRDPALEARREAIRAALADRCKRVVQTWAPCVDWGLLARGSLEGMVCFHPDAYDYHAGRLLAAESGVAARESGPLYLGAPDPELLEDLRAAVPVDA